MDLAQPVETARGLVAERFTDAVQAWLGGSVASGRLTATSDLDITVLLDQTEVHRESLTCRGWPVELFVHTEDSVRHFVEKDRRQRKPTMARLVADSIPLLGDDAGSDLREYCAGVLEAGPPALADDELQLARYFLTDLIDDVDGGATPPVIDAIAVELWRRSAELLLSSAGRWIGGGKALIREVEAFDAAEGTTYAVRLHAALHEAVSGTPKALVVLADEVLDRVGGRLRDGLYLAATLPDGAGEAVTKESSG